MFAFVLFIGIFVYAFDIELTRDRVGDEAPFADTLRAEGNDTLPENRSLGADQPHRTPRELAQWVSRSVSEVMTFDARGYEDELANAEKYFAPAGYAEYKAYLEQADMKNSLVQGQLKASVIVEQNPLLLNSGAVGGVFRWLYEVPVTISYVPQDATSLDPNAAKAATRKLTIRLQLGRHDAAENEDAVQIESWKVLARR